VKKENTIKENLVTAYSELAKEKIVMPQEIKLLSIWVKNF